jgi:hypothetical protein
MVRLLGTHGLAALRDTQGVLIPLLRSKRTCEDFRLICHSRKIHPRPTLSTPDAGRPSYFRSKLRSELSSVDGQGAFLRENCDYSHIDFFQSLERFREQGLPHDLPARLEADLNLDLQLCELKENLHKLKLGKGSATTLQEAERRAASYYKKLYRVRLREYQKRWVQDHRDWKILSRGKEVPSDTSKTDLDSSQEYLSPDPRTSTSRPENGSGRAINLESEVGGRSRPLLPVYSRLHGLLSAGTYPVGGACPVKCCQVQMDSGSTIITQTNSSSLPKTQRNQHIQTCVRREKASRLGRLQPDIHYCYLCFNWIVGDEWEPHCQTRFATLETKRCGTVTYCHTLVRPGYCPFCIGDDAHSATKRLESWTRDHKLWLHVNEHLTGRRWPVHCPHPLCNLSLEDETAFQFHLRDDHRFSWACFGSSARSNSQSPDDGPQESTKQGRKRKFASEDSTLQWMPSKCFRPISVSPESTSPISSVRKSRSTTPTIYPLLLSNLEDQIDSHEFQASCDARIESPTGEMIRPDLGCRNDLESSEWEWRSDIPALFDTMSTDSSSSGDSLFAQYIRSPSPTPSCSSASVVSDYSGKTAVASEGSYSSLVPSMKKKLSPQQKLECELVHDAHHQSE